MRLLLSFAAVMVAITILAIVFMRKYASMGANAYDNKMKLQHDQLNEQERKKRTDLEERLNRFETRKNALCENEQE